jgi:hypothetical protein
VTTLVSMVGRFADRIVAFEKCVNPGWACGIVYGGHNPTARRDVP